MMKHSLSVLCLSLVLLHTHFSLARRGFGGNFGKGFGGRKVHINIRGSTNSHAGNKNNKGSGSQGGYPKQPRPGYPGSYPQQPGGGYRSPYGGGHGRHGGFGGGYINHNPNNRVLSPHYGSRGFGRSAVRSAAGGAVVGMALGYRLGWVPLPPIHFHNPQEEYYYNHYMYRRYGSRSTDTNDYSRDYRYSKPPETYDNYMDSCMKKTNLLLLENPKPNNKPAATTINTTTVDSGLGNNTTETNSTSAYNSSTSAPSTPRPLTSPVPSPIEQMKARRCSELYMIYSEKYLKKKTEPSTTDGVQRLEMGLQGLLAVFTSTILMLLNSNMLMLLH